MIAVIADTHLPKGRRRLPERCVELLSGADAVIHAGDFTTVAVLREVEALCPVVHAVDLQPRQPDREATGAGVSMGLLSAARKQLIFEHVWL